jgi:hypothetical protein
LFSKSLVKVVLSVVDRASVTVSDVLLSHVAVAVCGSLAPALICVVVSASCATVIPLTKTVAGADLVLFDLIGVL